MESTDFDPNGASSPDSGVFGLPDSEATADFILVPVPFDATTSYRKGASKGPDAILEASRQVDLFDLDLGRVYEGGISLVERSAEDEERYRAWNRRAGALAQPIIDAAGALDDSTRASLDEVNRICGELNLMVEREVGRLMDAGKTVGLVGGDHATPFGAFVAHARRHPGMGILHVDAHADLRNAFEGFQWSHASIMYNAATRIPEVSRLVQVGIRDFCEDEYGMIQASGGRIRTHFDAALARRMFDGEPWTSVCRSIVADLPRDVYVSFDIDGLSPDLCPHTGTPVPGGLSFNQANRLMEVLVDEGHRIVGFDLNEVAPGPDGDEWDANVGARMLYKLIGWTRLSRSRNG